MDVDGSGTELVADISPAVKVRSIKPSPDEDMFALAGESCGVGGRTIKIWSDGQLSDLITSCCLSSATNASTAGLSWSPDGTRIAVLDNNTAYTGAILRTVNPDGTDVKVLVHRGTDGSLTPGQP